MSKTDIVNKFSKAQDSLVIQQSDFSLATIANMVENSSIDISPHYQRRDRWNAEKQSALIESFLINVPVPPVYLSEDDYGTYSVIDGKQRITAISDFLSGKLKLKKLKAFSELDGTTFKDLPSQLKNVLSVRPFIRVITLLKQSDPKLKYEVFLRLNTGGEKLKAQEIRNVAYSGSMNDLLFELAEHPFLIKKLKITSPKSTAYRNMDDLEHVLRFFTIRDMWENMGAVLSTEMDTFMASHREVNTNKFRKIFLSAIDRCEVLWGEAAFQKYANGVWRAQLISPLYDAQMVAASLLSEDELNSLRNHQEQIVDATKQLYIEDNDFIKSVSQSTNNPASIKRRVLAILNMLRHMVN